MHLQIIWRKFIPIPLYYEKYFFFFFLFSPHVVQKDGKVEEQDL